MPDVLAEMVRECSTLFVGKIELHLDNISVVRIDFHTAFWRFQGRGRLVETGPRDSQHASAEEGVIQR